MDLPQPDEPAYNGNVVVKSTTYGKSKRGSVTGVSKVRGAVKILNEEADKCLTLDGVNIDDSASLELQIRVNKALALELRRVGLRLLTFLKNNQ